MRPRPIARLEASYLASITPCSKDSNLFSGGLSAVLLFVSDATSAARIGPSLEDAFLVGIAAAAPTKVAAFGWHVVIQMRLWYLWGRRRLCLCGNFVQLANRIVRR
jgi:hypothetical protein